MFISRYRNKMPGVCNLREGGLFGLRLPEGLVYGQLTAALQGCGEVVRYAEGYGGTGLLPSRWSGSRDRQTDWVKGEILFRDTHPVTTSSN